MFLLLLSSLGFLIISDSVRTKLNFFVSVHYIMKNLICNELIKYALWAFGEIEKCQALKEVQQTLINVLPVVW